MGGGAIFFFIVVIGWVVLLFVMFNSGVAVMENGTPEARDEPEEMQELIPVDVAVYYETLCPYSKRFITTKLVPAYLRAPRLMNLSLVPYGNARTTLTPEGYEFSCQHGPRECQGNKIHSCAVQLVANQTSQLEYVACMMADERDPAAIAQKCAENLDIAWEPILDCAEGPLGNELLHTNGVRTKSVRPRLRGVPTTTFNGIKQNLSAVSRDLLGEVCKLFEDPKPEECLEGTSV